MLMIPRICLSQNKSKDYPRNKFGVKVSNGINHKYYKYSTNNCGLFTASPMYFCGIGAVYQRELRIKSLYFQTGVNLVRRGYSTTAAYFGDAKFKQIGLNVNLPFKLAFRHHKFVFSIGTYYDKLIRYSAYLNGEATEIFILKNGFNSNQIGGELSIGYWLKWKKERSALINLEYNIPVDIQINSIAVSLTYLI